MSLLRQSAVRFLSLVNPETLAEPSKRLGDRLTTLHR